MLDVIPREAFGEVAAKTAHDRRHLRRVRRRDRIPLAALKPVDYARPRRAISTSWCWRRAPRRDSAPTKQLVRVNGRPLMHTVVSRAVELAGHSVTVVLGANAGELAPLLKHSPASVAVNRDWAEGIASSIREGLAHAPTTPMAC